jgi:hypothetical protein
MYLLVAFLKEFIGNFEGLLSGRENPTIYF